MPRFGVVMFPTDYAIQPVELARAVEERGLDSLYFPEHTHIPTSRRTPFPGGTELPKEYAHTHDPFVALAAAAAVTSRIRLCTGICLVPQHDPIVLAKTIASLDVVSNGRFVFGIGAGWNAEEMEHHGTKYDTRWKVLRERVLAMKQIWSEEAAEFHGEFVDFDPIWSWPKPVQPGGPPILLGASSRWGFARVAEFCDGWLPIAGMRDMSQRPGAAAQRRRERRSRLRVHRKSALRRGSQGRSGQRGPGAGVRRARVLPAAGRTRPGVADPRPPGRAGPKASLAAAMRRLALASSRCGDRAGLLAAMRRSALASLAAMRRSALASLAAMLLASPLAGQPARAEAAREPCAVHDRLRLPFFGDTHVHTAFSQDASTQGTRKLPRDAYRFARGEPIGIQPYDDEGQALRHLQLARPLDFAIVTDHAEQLGEVAICDSPTLPGHDSWVCRMYRVGRAWRST